MNLLTFILIIGIIYIIVYFVLMIRIIFLGIKDLNKIKKTKI